MERKYEFTGETMKLSDGRNYKGLERLELLAM